MTLLTPTRSLSLQQNPSAASLLCAIEQDDFPFEEISRIAEIESWRKEVNRPTYHLHKWWAQRLGSVFRAIIIAALSPAQTDVLAEFYHPARFPEQIVFDPFMGSGTTIGEALKLGARAIGRDVNPVAHSAVRTALARHCLADVAQEYSQIEQDVHPVIQERYQALHTDGSILQTLYYFWVKTVPCPHCEASVDLFSSYVFSRHAYPARHPEAQAVCPRCGGLNKIRYDATAVSCCHSDNGFNPQVGPAQRAKMVCPCCTRSSDIAKAARRTGSPPRQRMYAKMVLLPDGTKGYSRSDNYDLRLFQETATLLAEKTLDLPEARIEPGYNTDQVLNYGYTHWRQMFNERQLFCLGTLQQRVRQVEKLEVRDLLLCLFSGILEFNNMFASFKGEGTGAVRNMFSHHILKPEKMPLEANVWGTPKSSGSFSTLFRSRVLRALEYAQNPFEIIPLAGRSASGESKVFGLSVPLGEDAADTYSRFTAGRQLYLSCGDSSRTDVASETVDAVITDPPFFDNVHYSELADFFYAWQITDKADRPTEAATTRSPDEVQQTDSAVFAQRLTGVWRECHRVLKPDGLLVFTYHHSRSEGWWSILVALTDAGFRITACHPVKSEMSGAAPKSQAKEPIDLDIIIVCRLHSPNWKPNAVDVEGEAERTSSSQVERFNRAGRRLSRNDVQIIVMAHAIRLLSQSGTTNRDQAVMRLLEVAVNEIVERLYKAQQVMDGTTGTGNLFNS